MEATFHIIEKGPSGMGDMCWHNIGAYGVRTKLLDVKVCTKKVKRKERKNKCALVIQFLAKVEYFITNEHQMRRNDVRIVLDIILAAMGLHCTATPVAWGIYVWPAPAADAEIAE